MNHDTVKNDYFWMAKAIQLAQQGRFTTSPNPRVGCVIVDENNQLLGQGHHIQAGTPHAESRVGHAGVHRPLFEGTVVEIAVQGSRPRAVDEVEVEPTV